MDKNNYEAFLAGCVKGYKTCFWTLLALAKILIGAAVYVTVKSGVLFSVRIVVIALAAIVFLLWFIIARCYFGCRRELKNY